MLCAIVSGLATYEHRDERADVLVVTTGWPYPEDPVYGIFIRRQVESLMLRGVRFDVLFIRGYKSRLAFVVAALRAAILNFRSRRYALIHAHGGEAALAARLYVRAPVLASYCGDDLLGRPREDGSFSLASRLRRTVQRQHTRLLTTTITKSREMEGTLPRRVRRRNRTIPNGVNRELFVPIPRDDARRQLGWGDERVALFAGEAAVPRKRYQLASAACDLARRVLPDLRLHVASGLDPRAIPRLMNAADCLVLTSVVEGSPNVVKEALACNLPVVTTRVGDVAELLDGVEPSFICDATADALSDALISCLRHPLRSNGRSRSKWLAEDTIANAIIEVYEQLGWRLPMGEDLHRRPRQIGATVD